MSHVPSRLALTDSAVRRNGTHLGISAPDDAGKAADSLRRRPPRTMLLGLAAPALVLLVILLIWGASPARPQPVADRGPRKDRVAANGLVEGASREIAVFPEVSGTLALVHVRVNQDVVAGALLFELNNDAQKAQVALAEAELISAEAQAQQARTDWERSQRLLPGRAISQEAYDTNYYRKLTMDAKVAESRARLTLARAELAKTQVRAPVAGQVLQVYQEAGTLVEPRKQGDPVLRLADVARRRVRAWVEELDAARVAVGQPAEATADGYPGQQFLGRVVEVAGRMGQDGPRSNRPGEREDVYYREVVIALEAGHDLPLNLRVEIFIDGLAAGKRP